MKRTRIINGGYFLLTLLPMLAFAEPDVSILYHEPFVVHETDIAIDGSTERLVFDAFGRRFVLLVDESIAGASAPGIELIQGHLAESSWSWARLMIRNETVSGFIQDMGETYLIEPRASLDAALLVGDTGASSPNVIYRLADTLVPAGLLSCDTQHAGEQVNAKDALAGLASELDHAHLHATTDGGVATVGVIADSFLYDKLNLDTQATVEQMFQTVTGIYQQQLDIEIEPVSITVSTARSRDPIGPDRDGSRLLDELGIWRMGNQNDVAITHLVTDRQLTNSSGKRIAA